MTMLRVVLGFGGDHVVHHVSLRSPNSEKVKTLPIAFRSTPWRTSPGGRCSPVVMIAAYVDGPGWQAVFGVVSGLVGCGHM